MALKFAKPGSGRGDRWEKNDHDDHLHAFVHPTDGGTHKFADRESDAVHVDYLICLDDNFVQADALVFGAALVPSLLAVDPDTIVVARLGKGTAQPGRTAPWLLFDPTAEDEAHAEKWFDEYTQETKFGKLVVEPPLPAGADESF